MDNATKKRLIFQVGLLLILESFFLNINWAIYGIPSLFIGDFHVHHWLIGLGLIGYAEVSK